MMEVPPTAVKLISVNTIDSVLEEMLFDQMCLIECMSYANDALAIHQEYESISSGSREKNVI